MQSSKIWHDIKVVINTLAFVTVIGAIVGVTYLYKAQANPAQAAPVYELPDFEHTNNQQFLDNVQACVDYIYSTTTDVYPVNVVLLKAQASLESGWGNSRFSLEGKNLFGIRTYDLREPHMLPSNKPKKWGVRVYMHECDSVQHYINIINNGSAYEKYRELRDNGIEDSLQYVETLGAYAADKKYFPKLRSIIKKLRTEYDIPQLK